MPLINDITVDQATVTNMVGNGMGTTRYWSIGFWEEVIYAFRPSRPQTQAASSTALQAIVTILGWPPAGGEIGTEFAFRPPR